MRARSTLFCGLALIGCQHVRTFDAPGGPVEVVGLAPAEMATVIETYRGLERLSPAALQIPESEYRARSTFRALYGFELQGDLLVAWLRGATGSRAQ